MRRAVFLVMILLIAACGRKGDPVAPDDPVKNQKKKDSSYQNFMLPA